ncbi:MAG TPA: ABC transporter permease [Terriglobales bacterium]|nr:ABC transporter permease [Terriglobales bacterium]
MASNLQENLSLAYDTVRSHKLRSALTILGVFVGTVTLMAIGSILTGMNKTVVDQLESFGTNTIFIYKFAPGIHIGRLTREERMRPPLSDRDVEAVRRDCGACSAISAQVMPNNNFGPGSGSINARYRSHEVDGLDFTGTEPNFPQATNQAIQAGRFFTQAEDDHRSNVVVVGKSVADALFPDQDPLDRDFQIDGTSFRLIGVFAPRKGAGPDQQDLSARVPYKTFEKLYPAAQEHAIEALARPGLLSVAQDQIEVALRRSRGDKWGKPDSFGMATADSIIGQFHDITGQVALVIVAIASIGMLIGGVGVMNIMLVSVTERTREIGIRKAIGARRSDISQQFLAEAVFLTGIGGLLGILGGWLISELIKVLIPSLPSSVPLWSVGLGFGISVAIGVFFGLFPAMKAAKLDPVEALRYE